MLQSYWPDSVMSVHTAADEFTVGAECFTALLFILSAKDAVRA